MKASAGDSFLFQARSPLGKTIRVTEGYWQKIVSIKHPSMAGREQQVKAAIEFPEQVRVSRSDPKVFLYYRKEGEFFVVVVAKHLNGEGFIITAYLTDKIKEGTPVWPRSG